VIEAVNILLSSLRSLSSSFSSGKDGSRKSYFEITSTEDSFNLKDEFCRANRELFETTGSTALEITVEAIQFRKHVGRSRGFVLQCEVFQDFVEMSTLDSDIREERTCHFNKCKSNAKEK